MEMTELAELIKTRRSIRAWQDKDVPREQLEQAIELATWAPNGGNQQNWRFYLIMNKETIGKIADAVEESAKLIASWPEASDRMDVSMLVQRSGFFRSAPAAIAVAASRYQSPIDQIMEAREGIDEEAARIRSYRNTADSRIQSVSAAVAYLLLVLHGMGIGSLWMTGPLQAKAQIEKILNVPDELDVVTFIPVGYPATEPGNGERKPFSEVCEIIE